MSSDNKAPDVICKFTGIAPVLLVSDVRATIAHFENTMGFTLDLFADDAMFAIIQRDGNRIMLQQAHDKADIVPNWKKYNCLWDVYIWVDNVDALYEEFKQRGAIIDYELHTKPYNVREFGSQDLDDHDIAFGQIIG